MKLRKLAAAGLVLALGLSLGAPAFAAEAADARLTKVTLAVKGTLDIDDSYTQFYGQPDETPLGTRWDLNWSGEDRNLTVSATDEGKVLYMSYREDQNDITASSGSYGSGPSFPAMTRAQAQEAAQAFLSRVLSDNEEALFSGEEEESLSAEDYSFRGSILLNALPSPMTFYLRVRLRDGTVTSFWRGDVSDYAGQPTPAGTSTTGDKARELLKSTLSLRLEYVLDADSEMAVLRYLPNSTDEFYVDAATGELVNLTELQRMLREQYAVAGGDNMVFNTSMKAADAAAEEGAASLTEIELEGVAKLEDVLDKEALDKATRAWSELGLGSYTLGSATYSVNRETSEVTARITYAKNTEDGIYRRYITVDAKTGQLLSMSGSNPFQVRQDGVRFLSAQAAQEKAEAFLTLLWGDQFARTEVYNAPDPETDATLWAFTFAQKVNGYFFPGNSISVRVDAADGSIMGFSKNFDDDVTFDSAQGLISEEAAIDAWCQSYPVELGYMEIPVALDMSAEFELLRNAGYHYYNTLKPGYALGEREYRYTGVDAKTGQLAKTEYHDPAQMIYDDLEGHWAQEILTELARYRVGWWGGKAEPDKALTQLDYIKLLASADGYLYDPETEDVESLYNYAIRRGILTKESRQDDKVLTRAEMVEMLLNSLGYGPVARLSGIFRCDFADADLIPEAQLGYAALAQGLGIVSGDSLGSYAPQRPAVRSEAAVMLWKYMKR